MQSNNNAYQGKTQQFDVATQQGLKYYVYMLVDPTTNRPFYIGKGVGNRVFAHVDNVKKGKGRAEPKNETILEILQKGYEVQHVIVRHGMDEDTAFKVEASLIDAFNYYYVRNRIDSLPLTNLVSGHDKEHGLLSDIQICNKYSAQPIEKLTPDCIIININKLYPSCKDDQDILEATSKAWVINKNRVKKVKTVLSEYRGLIVGVFTVHKWYEIQAMYNEGTKNEGKKRIRWAFEGESADESVRNKYFGKCLPPYRKQNPILYPEFVNSIIVKNP